MTDKSEHVRFKLQEQHGEKEYWHIDQSQGGVYTLPQTSDSGQMIAAVGSTGCRVCVCVFVELSKTTCFAAHISAIDHAADSAAGKRGFTSPEQLTKDNRSRIVPDESKADQLIEIVIKNLRESPSLSKYVNEGVFSGRAGRAIVVCPMKIWGGERATGSFIIQALEQFFGVKMDCQTGHGFLASSEEDKWSLQTVGWKSDFVGPTESDTDLYPAKHEEDLEKYGWVRTNAIERPALSGQWAFAFTLSGRWVHYFDRDE